MAERRPLLEGLKKPAGIDRTKEEQFIFGSSEKRSPSPAQSHTDAQATPASTGQGHLAPKVGGEGKAPTPSVVGRVPLTARIRPELASALKRASLERQLEGIRPNSVQDILEAALEPWLRANGYLT